MSKAVVGIAVAALVISLVALGVVAYTYVMATNAINNSNNNNNNQQTTVTVNDNSQNGGCTSNCNSQTNGQCPSNCNSQTNGQCTSNCNSQTNGGCTSNCNGGGTTFNSQTTGVCTNCNGNGTTPSIVTVISGTTATLDQCQGHSNTQTYTTAATNNNQCYLTGNQVLTFSFVAGASGLSASGSFQSQNNIDVKFTDVTASQTLKSQTQTTSSSISEQLTSGHTYVIQFTNDESQNNVLSLSSLSAADPRTAFEASPPKRSRR